MYSKQNEIHKYLEDMAIHYNIIPNMRFGAKVKSCIWSEATKMHTVTTTDGKTYEANFVIKCTGMIHETSTPNFEGTEYHE